MHKILVIRFEKVEEELQVRSNREQLIADIVNATSEKNKKALAKLISLRANQMKWSDMDLHALLKKRQDPTIRNFTAFVKWSIKLK
jgi:hypothetical protein